LRWSHLSHWAWNKWYHRERYLCRSASYLDLRIKIYSEGWLRTKLYYRRDDFNFPIVNFPFICSNIPAAPAYGVFISQVIWYSRACGSYLDFLDRGLLLTRKLKNQYFLLGKLKSSVRKFYGRHHDLVNRYGISVLQMTMDMFHCVVCSSSIYGFRLPLWYVHTLLIVFGLTWLEPKNYHTREEHDNLYTTYAVTNDTWYYYLALWNHCLHMRWTAEVVKPRAVVFTRENNLPMIDNLMFI
jgi:hypothetical protein